MIGEPGNWWYFGKNAPSLKGLLGDDNEARERVRRLLYRGRGYSYNGLCAGDTEALIAALRRNWKAAGCIGKPIDP